ncbi:phosphoglucomutase, alpha-D-glucose phosphate-specific, partial [Vibrio natriegens]
AGQRAQQEDMHNIPALVANYFLIEPDVQDSQQKVAFGTSGHRGTADKGTFNQHHIWAIAQAVAEVRAANGVTGPLFLGKDTHALSEPAFTSTLEVLVANGVQVVIQQGRGYTPTPGI